MTIQDDKRLIEDYLPTQGISKETSRKKNIREVVIGAPIGPTQGC